MILEHYAAQHILPNKESWTDEDVNECHQRYCSMYFGEAITQPFPFGGSNYLKYQPWTKYVGQGTDLKILLNYMV